MDYPTREDIAKVLDVNLEYGLMFWKFRKTRVPNGMEKMQVG